MSNGDAQFDSMLGGSQELPDRINLMRFAAARSKEIQCIKQQLKSTKSTKLAFQKLPKHMRRRVMSHNARRLPRRLREVHLNQLKKSGMPPKQKRPSRKFRRRPANLLEAYRRRREKCNWLETHIWHAKRFHMVNKWGYRLGDRPCDKSFRACYRATTKHCLLQDVSYIKCVELTGTKNVLLSNLEKICCKGEGLGIGAKAFADGKREGLITIYTICKKPIGKINFHWKPVIQNEINVIWLWIHSAFYDQVYSTLKQLFNSQDVKLNELQDLNRFSLTGPISQGVLNKVLTPVNVTRSNDIWLKTFLENDDCRQIFAEQLNYWNTIKELNSPAMLPPHIMTSLIVTDPRYNFPLKRTKAENYKTDECIEFPPNLSLGPIWDAETRTRVTENKISNAAIADLRSQLLVPGTDLEQPGVAVPVLLIQKPGNPTSGGGCGWDVVIPAGWAQPFWLCLIMWGARAGGLHARNSHDFELGRNHFLTPDTEAGAQNEKEMSDMHTNKFFRLPPNKRTNFAKFAISNPFRLNWHGLLSDWSKNKTAVDSFLVLRNIKYLQTIQDAITKKTKLILPDDVYKDNYLVPVKLFTSKGIFKTYSIICLPTSTESKSKIAPVEKLIKDANQEERKHMRNSHRSLLKRLKRKRHLAKQAGKKIEIDKEMLANYTAKMRELWLPNNQKVRFSCSREVIGFVSKGEFSFALGKSCCVGYVALQGLKTFLDTQSGRDVLIRGTRSRQYRFAEIEVIK